MTVVERYSDIQKISLNFRNVLFLDLPWAGSSRQPLTQQDVRNVLLTGLLVILLNHQIMTKERVIYWFRCNLAPHPTASEDGCGSV